MREGYTIVWVGWEADIPAAALRIVLPAALFRRPALGRVQTSLVTSKAIWRLEASGGLLHRRDQRLSHLPRPPVD